MTYVNAVKLPRVDIITISVSEEMEKKIRSFTQEGCRFLKCTIEFHNILEFARPCR